MVHTIIKQNRQMEMKMENCNKLQINQNYGFHYKEKTIKINK